MLQTLREFIAGCPLLKGRRLGLDLLESGVGSFSLSQSGAAETQKTYTDGTSLEKLEFVLSQRTAPTALISKSAESAELCEGIAAWITGESRAGRLPDAAEGSGVLRVESIEAVFGGSAHSVRDGASAREIIISVYYLAKQ